MITVAVAGCAGRMGSCVVEAVTAADDMCVICGIDPRLVDSYDFPVYTTIHDALAAGGFEVLVDFTQPSVVEGNISAALADGINCVVGTTGLSTETLQDIVSLATNDACLFYAPNFTTGAVLMMQFAKAAAPYFPEAEIIEFHHANKKDAPSGTAIRSAEIISHARGDSTPNTPGPETEISGMEGARGAQVFGVPLHSVRSMGFVASQEILFGSFGQVLTIRHDSWDRHSYMPGVLLGIRNVCDQTGLIIGLENFMSD